LGYPQGRGEEEMFNDLQKEKMECLCDSKIIC